LTDEYGGVETGVAFFCFDGISAVGIEFRERLEDWDGEREEGEEKRDALMARMSLLQGWSWT
jgi:hypothetical protein